jgi:hypothetical protein
MTNEEAKLCIRSKGLHIEIETTGSYHGAHVDYLNHQPFW